MNDNSRQQPILVIGGTGKTGRRVVERLTARGLPVRVGSRSGTPPFDWEDRSTWVPVLEGVGAVYLTYYPDVAVPGAVDAISTFIDLAVRGDPRRLVLLTGRGDESAQRAERYLQQVDIDWTIVRASWFAQNFSENFFLDPILGGELALPAGEVCEPFVDADDIADVVEVALTAEGHGGEVYEVTGPRLLTFRQAVAEIAGATGRDIRYRHISTEDFAAALEQEHVPADVIWLLTYLFDTELDGRNECLTDGVQRALGREPRDFRDYAREAAATGVWNPITVRAT